MKKTKKKTTKNLKKEILFKFLKRTKEGKYAPVEMSSIPYSRVSERTEIIEDVYFYGLE